MMLRNEARKIEGLRGDAVEVIARFRAEGATSLGVRVRCSDDGTRALPVMWRNGHVIVGQDTPQLPCTYAIAADGEVEIRIILDKGILDVCIDDGRLFETRIHSVPRDDLGFEVFAEGGGATLLSFDAWQMAPARVNHDRLFQDQ